MPIYDFHCRACGHEFEALVRPQDAPGALTCPTCQSRDLERLLSTFAVSSAEKTQAAAAMSRKKAATTARRDNIAIEREAEMHRREDH
ncbi:MAG TPA: zinc ribbon domain-containing protein [Vicinamibacterales bacterium]|jgi:putative FmdB family regulatory protein|nr:zinc ribbon domain-containing protein [Vicinamibacterales bacterium]